MTGDRLPNFLIVGAMRSGTTSLARYLGAHPSVFMATQKEVHFFDRHYDRGISWYTSQFKTSGPVQALGEASQTYMYDPVARSRMATTVPDAKLIAILRDPVDRAYSHYWLNRALGTETLSFSDALDAEPERLQRSRRDRDMFSYVDRGRYVQQLQGLCEWYRRDQLLVLFFDELRRSPISLYQRACEFLEIDPAYIPSNLGRPINRYTPFRSLLLRRASRRFPGIVGRIVGHLNARQGREYPPLAPDQRAEVNALLVREDSALRNWLGLGALPWSLGERSKIPKGAVPEDLSVARRPSGARLRTEERQP